MFDDINHWFGRVLCFVSAANLEMCTYEEFIIIKPGTRWNKCSQCGIIFLNESNYKNM